MKPLLSLLLFAAALPGQPPAAAPSLEGNWQGTLDAGPVKLRLVVKVAKGPGGALTATMDSVDQGANNIPIETLTFAQGVFRFAIPRIMGSYEGKLSADGKKISGTWSQGGASLPLNLERATQAFVLNRPQEPKRPFPYEEVEVAVDSVPGVKLACTLTLPKAEGRFAAAFLITGSGPQDRDEAIMGHKPFLVLSDALTRQGIAVLRCDDRGAFKSTGNLATATSEDFAKDAAAAAAYLKAHARVDPKRVGFIGHSEGGIIAPMVAAQDPGIAFVVMIAGIAVTGEQLLYEQGALIAKASGATPEMIAMQREQQEKLFAIVKSEPDQAQRALKLKEMAGAAPAAQAQIEMAASPWLRYFLTYDPVPVLAKLRCPVLAIFGEKDLQVPPSQNAGPMEKALKTTDATVKVLPGLNHLLQTAKTGNITEYGQIEETMSPAALRTIGDWVASRTKSGR